MKEIFDIAVAGITEVEMLEGTPFTKVISISDADIEVQGGYEEMLRELFPEAQIYITYFDDVEYERADGPDWDEVERILMFSRSFNPSDRILVHCRAGISRSAAVACAITAQHTPPGQEKWAVQYVRSVRPQMLPNFLIIKLADQMLGREGRLIKAVAAQRGLL